MQNIKARLLQHCFSFVNNRIETAQNAIRSVQESTQEESKSSVGDKYETGRAMMHLEIEKNTTQLAEAKKLLQTLHLIQLDTDPYVIGMGNLVMTTQGNFFVAISAGKISMDDTDYFIVSPASPLGSKLIGKKIGDSFTMNGKELSILKIA